MFSILAYGLIPFTLDLLCRYPVFTSVHTCVECWDNAQGIVLPAVCLFVCLSF